MSPVGNDFLNVTSRLPQLGEFQTTSQRTFFFHQLISPQPTLFFFTFPLSPLTHLTLTFIHFAVSSPHSPTTPFSIPCIIFRFHPSSPDLAFLFSHPSRISNSGRVSRTPAHGFSQSISPSFFCPLTLPTFLTGLNYSHTTSNCTRLVSSSPTLWHPRNTVRSGIFDRAFIGFRWLCQHRG